ncbi:MAG TPA: sialate O-acetylesterase [Polyangia bacterium]
MAKPEILMCPDEAPLVNRTRRRVAFHGCLAALAVLGCHSSSGTPNSGQTGGISGSGGATVGSGGRSGTGGASSLDASLAGTGGIGGGGRAGSPASGGSSEIGGRMGSGGTAGDTTGGNHGQGGSAEAGGAAAMGSGGTAGDTTGGGHGQAGSAGTGGAAATGGSGATGGISGTGGSTRTDAGADAGDAGNTAKAVRVFVLAGQSNACGNAYVSPLPQALQTPQKSVLFYASGTLTENPGGVAQYPSHYGWDVLKPGFGDQYLYANDPKHDFGPEVTFGHDMSAAHTGELLAIIKSAYTGTDLYNQWLSSPSASAAAGRPVGELWPKFTKTVTDALQALKDTGYAPDVRGMLWMQGEYDANTDQMGLAYEKNLTNFIADVRSLLGKPSMAVAIGKITTTWPRSDLVRAAEDAVAAKVANVKAFDTDDIRAQGHMVDAWHYDTVGMQTLGSRFATALQQLGE